MIGAKDYTGGLRLLAAAMAVTAAALRADLAPTSPFLPAGAAGLAAGAGGPSGPIELRGIMGGPDGTAFCIYDTAKKKDIWVGLNETGHDFVVKSADASRDSVTVAYQGRLMKLDLHTSKVAAAAAAANPGASAAVTNPSPADEQRRLDAVAQEVRRRRAERERAAGEAPGQGVPGAPGGPAVAPGGPPTNR